jgi:3-hydroxybutyryl-CoA dehydrogenase
MAYSLPEDVDQRPVTIAGAGTLGCRIATVFAAGGSDVRFFDTSVDQLEAGRFHVEQHVVEVQQTLDLRPDRTGGVEVAGDLSGAVHGAWLVIESVPERVDLKIEVFGELDRVAEPGAILATNSSSLPSRLVIEKVRHPERVLNMHFQQPPELNAVELMSCGKTDSELIDGSWRSCPATALRRSASGARATGSSSTASGRPSNASA